MKFINQTTNLAEAMAGVLTDALLRHERVVWLVSGGSNIDVSVGASRLLDSELTKKLTILQVDERFVAMDSADCNWRQLIEQGFETKQATTHPILTGASDIEVELSRYRQVADSELKASYQIAQLGVGSDYHIAGIKPGSIATTSSELVESYQAEDYQRITLTNLALSQLDQAVVFAYGADKLPVLERLTTGSHDPINYPADILHSVDQVTIYSDHTRASLGGGETNRLAH